MSNVTRPTGAVKSPADLADLMGRQGYKLRFIAEGEAIILRPDPHATPYLISLTGHTFALGCTCLGAQYRGRCKHIAVVGAYRLCDEPGCTGIQEYHEVETIGGPMHVYECLTCGKTTDPRHVYEKRQAASQSRPQTAA